VLFVVMPRKSAPDVLVVELVSLRPSVERMLSKDQRIDAQHSETTDHSVGVQSTALARFLAR
jgi:hypothetical protein